MCTEGFQVSLNGLGVRAIGSISVLGVNWVSVLHSSVTFNPCMVWAVGEGGRGGGKGGGEKM